MNNYFFYYLVLLSSWIPILFLGIKLKSQNKQTRFRFTFYLFILARCLTDLGVLILEKLASNTFPVFHFSVLIEFILVLELFYSINNYKIPKAIFFILSIICFSLDATVTSNFFENNHINTMYSYIVLSGFGVQYLFRYTGDVFQKLILGSTSVYTIAFMFLLYFEDLFFSSKELNNYLLNFMALLSLVLNILFSYALCLKPKN